MVCLTRFSNGVLSGNLSVIPFCMSMINNAVDIETIVFDEDVKLNALKINEFGIGLKCSLRNREIFIAEMGRTSCCECLLNIFNPD